jgi:hypothetical protein
VVIASKETCLARMHENTPHCSSPGLAPADHFLTWTMIR